MFTPSTTEIHVDVDSVAKAIHDSVERVRSEMVTGGGGASGLTGTGMQDYLTYWINDSTLSLWIRIDSMKNVLDRAQGRRDSTVIGAYDIAAFDWALPGYIDEPPYPSWYTKDWKRWKKIGMYVDPASPLQLLWHPQGDSVMVFQFKLPRARLLQFLGIDSTLTSVGPKFRGIIYPDSGSNWSTFQTLALNDSTRSFRLVAGPGITFKPMWNSAAHDTLLLGLEIDYQVLWNRIKDSVLAHAGAGGATTFLDLTDTPNSYVGQAGKIPRVKSTEDQLEFSNPSDITFDNIVITTQTIDSTCQGGIDSVCVQKLRWSRPRLFHSSYSAGTGKVPGQRVGSVTFRFRWASPTGSNTVKYVLIATDSTNDVSLVGCYGVGSTLYTTVNYAGGAQLQFGSFAIGTANANTSSKSNNALTNGGNSTVYIPACDWLKMTALLPADADGFTHFHQARMALPSVASGLVHDYEITIHYTQKNGTYSANPITISQP